MSSSLLISEVWGKHRLNFRAPWKGRANSYVSASSLDCKHFLLWCGHTGFCLYLDLVCEIWLTFPPNIIICVLDSCQLDMIKDQVGREQLNCENGSIRLAHRQASGGIFLIKDRCVRPSPLRVISLGRLSWVACESHLSKSVSSVIPCPRFQLLPPGSCLISCLLASWVMDCYVEM